MRINVCDQGAIGDGQTLNTRVLQGAIDAVAREGGGVVHVPAGCYLTGMLRLRSHVHLHLETGAILQASPRVEDHPTHRLVAPDCCWNDGADPDARFHLLLAENCEDITLSGDGVLDGNGTAWYDPSTTLPWPQAHPGGRRMAQMLELHQCRGVRIENLRLRNTGNWTLHLHECDDVSVRGIHLHNPPTAPNADGIDITGCRNVRIADCLIDTCDDAICVKTFPGGRSSENIIVTGCILRTHCAALKLGSSESYQDMRHIQFSNCIVRESHRAIAVYSSRGAIVEDLSFTDIQCDTRLPLLFPRPIHLQLESHPAGFGAGTIRDVRIRGVSALTNGRILMTAAPGLTLQDISLRDIDLRYVDLEDPRIVGARVGGGQFSAANPWARIQCAAIVGENIRGLELDRVRVRWPQGPVPREWEFAEKIANGSQERYAPAHWRGAEAPVYTATAFKNVDGLIQRNCTLEDL